MPKNSGQALRLSADKKQKSNFPEYSPSVPPTGVDRTKQAVVYKGDMKREWPRMGPKEKNSGRHRLAAHATLPDRRNMFVAHLSGHVVCVVTPRTAAWRVNRLVRSVWRQSGFEIGADLATNFTPLGGDASQPRWMTAQARMFGNLAPSPGWRGGQDDCPAKRPATLRVGRFRKGPAPATHTNGVGGSGRIKHRIAPAGLSAGPHLHHPGNARRASGVMRASAWRRMSGSAWRSMAHQSSTLYVVAMLPLARS